MPATAGAGAAGPGGAQNDAGVVCSAAGRSREEGGGVGGQQGNEGSICGATEG